MATLIRLGVSVADAYMILDSTCPDDMLESVQIAKKYETLKWKSIIAQAVRVADNGDNKDMEHFMSAINNEIRDLFTEKKETFFQKARREREEKRIVTLRDRLRGATSSKE